MKCNVCKNEIKVIRGGMFTEADSTDIKMLHVHGCMNKHCSESMKEVSRNVSIVESFKEDVEEDPKESIDININITSNKDFELLEEAPPEEQQEI